MKLKLQEYKISGILKNLAVGTLRIKRKPEG